MDEYRPLGPAFEPDEKILEAREKHGLLIRERPASEENGPEVHPPEKHESPLP